MPAGWGGTEGEKFLAAHAAPSSPWLSSTGANDIWLPVEAPVRRSTCGQPRRNSGLFPFPLPFPCDSGLPRMTWIYSASTGAKFFRLETHSCTASQPTPRGEDGAQMNAHLLPKSVRVGAGRDPGTPGTTLVDWSGRAGEPRLL